VIDIHVHILPGLDDGPDDMQEALTMCRLEAEDGVRTIVATPHMFDGAYHVEVRQILDGTGGLRDCVRQEGLPLEIVPGADVHLTTDVCQLLREGKVMTVGNAGKYVMLELPQDVLPAGVADILFNVQLQGIVSILSHPERNREFQAEPERLVPFVQAGNLVQLTAASIVGGFGRHVQEVAHLMLSMRLAHLVASDAHSPSRRPPGLSEARKVVESLLSASEAEEIFERRPREILLGNVVTLPDPDTRRAARKKRWWFF